MEGSHIPGPAYGALDNMAKLPAKLLLGSKDPEVKALSEAVRANWVSLNPLVSQQRHHLSEDGPRLPMIPKDEGLPGYYPRSHAPVPFTLVQEQSTSFSYKMSP